MLKIKYLTLIFSIFFYIPSYSSNTPGSCYNQFAKTLKLPINEFRRHEVWKDIQSDPNKYADQIGLPKNQDLRNDFFRKVEDIALPISNATEVTPVIRHKKNENGVYVPVIDKLGVKFANNTDRRNGFSRSRHSHSKRQNENPAKKNSIKTP